MTFHESVNIEDVVNALKELGGEAEWEAIRERVIANQGDCLPSGYSYWDSYVKTIFQIIQQHCRGYKKFKGHVLFEKARKSRFRLVKPGLY